MKFEQKFKVGIREIGLRNEMTNYGFLAILEDIATFHSDTVGYGVKDMPINKGAWLLMDWELEVLKRPAFNEEIYVKTYALKEERISFHCYRNFEIYNSNDELVATATSKWIFYNFEIRKITKIDSNTMEIFKTEGDPEKSEEKLQKLIEPNTYNNVFEYKVNRFDIDINMHMNNLNYLKVAYEALPEDIFMNKEYNHLRITYKHQVKIGDSVKCFYSNEKNEHYITIKNNNENKTHAIIKLW